jgi:DNA-directed RNA polymerase subunit RPC12/RpoP
MFFFFFANVQRGIDTVEQRVGRCPFCSTPAAVDILEYHTQTFWFGLIPSKDQVDRMAVCRYCGKSIKEAYYTMSDKPKNEDIPMVESGKPAN